LILKETAIFQDIFIENEDMLEFFHQDALHSQNRANLTETAPFSPFEMP